MIQLRNVPGGRRRTQARNGRGWYATLLLKRELQQRVYRCIDTGFGERAINARLLGPGPKGDLDRLPLAYGRVRQQISSVGVRVGERLLGSRKVEVVVQYFPLRIATMPNPYGIRNILIRPYQTGAPEDVADNFAL